MAAVAAADILPSAVVAGGGGAAAGETVTAISYLVHVREHENGGQVKRQQCQSEGGCGKRKTPFVVASELGPCADV